jgi:hypothetical protein
MRVRTYSRTLKTTSAITLAFFLWSFGPLFQVPAAFAAEKPRVRNADFGVRNEAQKTVTTGERFEKALEEIREKVGQVEVKLDKNEDTSSAIDTINKKRAEIESLDVEIKKEFAATEKKLKDANLPKEILDRHYKFVKHYEDNLTELKTNLSSIEKPSAKSQELRAALQKAKAHLEKVKPPKKHKPFNPTRLPTRTREMKPIQTSWFDKAMNWLVPSAEAAELPPTSADLAETLETPKTQEIRDLSQKLGGTPVALYEYVRNVYIYEPYAGSTKGAVQTLKEKTGNEWDQASLLIALYRASGIPARYVVGTVEIPIDKAMSWLGVEDPRMAGTLLSTQGRPTSLVISGGKITALRTQHVWVRAFVPFLLSRGATPGPGDMWVDIDPSFKGQTITKTLTVTGAPTFDQSTYLSTFRTDSPFEFYRSQLQGFLDANNPGYVPEALAWENEITPERFGVLIGQPPYIIKSVTGTYSEIPDSYRQKFTLSITDPSTGDSLLYYTAPMPQVIGKRMTLSYAPATATDEATIAFYGGIYSTPPYLVMLKPEIKINGVSAIQGNAIGSGQEQNMEFVFDTTIDQGRVENTIIAGGYYAIGLSARSGDTLEYIQERTDHLATITGTIDFNDSVALDEKLGEILYLSAMVFHQHLDAITKKIASIDHVVDVREISEMMYFLTLKVDSIFGMPRKITPTGITGDMDRNLHTVAPFDGDMNHIKPFMQLQGNESSFLEHDVTEKVYQTQALSAVKGIQLAHDQGITVHTINSQNISTELPMLQLLTELKADITNAVNAGQKVIVPERNLILRDWSGVGYIVQDPVNGKGAYLISGGYGGAVVVYINYIKDLATAALADIASSTAKAGLHQLVCYPGHASALSTINQTCYHEVTLSEACGNNAACRNTYQFTHLDYVQPLIDIQEHGADANLTEHIKAGDWQSHDTAQYMRAGSAVLTAIEVTLGYFSVNNPQLSAGYRTYTYNRSPALKKSGSSDSSHHCDGVAADITPTDPTTPEKCKVLNEAYFLIGNKGEVLAEGKKSDGNYKTSAHIAIPGKPNDDRKTQAVQWRCR